MKKSQRALAGMVVIDALVLLGAAWMVLQTKSGAWHSSDPATAISMIMTTAGGVVGVVSAILLMAWLIHRRAGN